ncbi:5317_t:CDS:1, partial [Gigaspora margarita]
YGGYKSERNVTTMIITMIITLITTHNSNNGYYSGYGYGEYKNIMSYLNLTTSIDSFE